MINNQNGTVKINFDRSGIELLKLQTKIKAKLHEKMTNQRIDFLCKLFKAVINENRVIAVGQELPKLMSIKGSNVDEPVVYIPYTKKYPLVELSGNL